MNSQDNSSATTRQRVAINGTVLLLIGLLVFLMGGAVARGASPTPVDLLKTDRFAVLAGAGITNAGETTITGGVGTFPTTSETGFGGCPALNCVNLTGTNHAGDLVTQGAKTNLITAYNQAASYSRSTINTELAPAIPDPPLVPGVYTSASTTFQITNTLTLDAQGDPDGVFIFYMGSTGTSLTTAVGSNVVLQGDAQACNVFWVVAGTATLFGGAGIPTTFVGNILAYASITVGDNVTINGRLLARTGSVTLIHDTITRANCANKPGGGVGGPCNDPAYYGIFDNTASTVPVRFKLKWTNGSGVHVVTRWVPGGSIYRTWEHWAKPGTKVIVSYKKPSTGNWVKLDSLVAVHGWFAACVYQHGLETP
ncbi:MAG: ice-binding family protein [Chloroflexota bacterium]